MSKVLYITNIPSPYRVEYFNNLGKKVDLTVVFERKSSDERDDAWSQYAFTHFNGYFLKGRKIGVNKALSFDVCSYITAQKWDYIVCTDVYSPTGLIAIYYMKLKRIPYWIEGDGAFVGNAKGLKAAVKRHIYRTAKGLFSTCHSHDEYYTAYGADKARLRRYHFSSIRQNDILKSPLTKTEKQALRDKLNMPEEHIVLSVGQFIYRKGFDVLLKSAKDLADTVGIYIVGGKPTEEYTRLVAENGLKHIHFLDFMDKSSLAEYYRAADVFVFPTREDIWGLVINEAMAQGLPVISTNRCCAALELIRQGENGYIVPVDDVPSLSQCINNVFHKDLDTMAKASLDIIKDYTIEQMAEDHYTVFQ